MIIWIASLPRAGNTLFRMLLHHYCKVYTYSFYNDIMFFRHDVAHTIGHVVLPMDLVEFVENGGDGPDRYTFIKAHHYPKALPGSVRTAVCVIRDPRDAAVSLAHYKNWKGKVPFQKALSIVVNRYNWTNYILGWREIPNLAIVRYEDMMREPRHTLERSINTLGLDLPIQTSSPPPTFKKLQEKLPRFFRAGKMDTWREVLSERQVGVILKRHGEMMQEMGYL